MPPSPGILLAAHCSLSLMVWLTLGFGAAAIPPHSWKSLGRTDLYFPLHYASKAKLSYGPNLHLSADCCKRLLRSLGGKKWGRTCCDFVKSGLDWVTKFSLHRGTLVWNSLTPGFTMKIYPFFEYLQFAIKILTWRDRCNFIGYDSSNPFVQFSGL